MGESGKRKKTRLVLFENDTSIGRKYGRMYNWYAVDDPRGLCPEGWHIPTNDEWIVMENYLGIPEAGLRMKCKEGWNDYGNGNNSSNFCVLPGGYRSRDGRFTGIGEFTYLTGSTEDKLPDSKENKSFIWGRGIHFADSTVLRCGLDKEFGLYVRCIKDR